LTFFDFIVSARFHGLVLAALTGKPFVGVGDTDKIQRFCKKMGMPFLSWHSSDKELREALTTLTNHAELADKSMVTELSKSAENTIDHVFR
jgi:polysaccharide pyruvyl transferase WcaK-like protein